jgi:hypothetical protein
MDGSLELAGSFCRAPDVLVHHRVELRHERDHVWIEHRGHVVAPGVHDREHRRSAAVSAAQAQSAWTAEAAIVCPVGSPGTGKTQLAVALGIKARHAGSPRRVRHHAALGHATMIARGGESDGRIAWSRRGLGQLLQRTRTGRAEVESSRSRSRSSEAAARVRGGSGGAGQRVSTRRRSSRR